MADQERTKRRLKTSLSVTSGFFANETAAAGSQCGFIRVLFRHFSGANGIRKRKPVAIEKKLHKLAFLLIG